jgi:hypothetical protein
VTSSQTVIRALKQEERDLEGDKIDMELKETRVFQQREHTARDRADDLFFQRERVITSPRELDDPFERDPFERKVLADPFNPYNKHLGNFLGQEVRADHFNSCQRGMLHKTCSPTEIKQYADIERVLEDSENPIMDETNENLINIASLPIFEEPDWNKVSRVGTVLPPPLSLVQNIVPQHEFTGHFSDWLVDSISSPPNTSLSRMPLQEDNDSHMLHPSFQDVIDLETLKKAIGRSSDEPLELHQPPTKSA